MTTASAETVWIQGSTSTSGRSQPSKCFVTIGNKIVDLMQVREISRTASIGSNIRIEYVDVKDDSYVSGDDMTLDNFMMAARVCAHDGAR